MREMTREELGQVQGGAITEGPDAVHRKKCQVIIDDGSPFDWIEIIDDNDPVPGS